MFRECFSRLDSTALPIAAMLFFMAAFALVIVRAARRSSHLDEAHLATLPLEEAAESDSPVAREESLCGRDGADVGQPCSGKTMRLSGKKETSR